MRRNASHLSRSFLVLVYTKKDDAWVVAVVLGVGHVPFIRRKHTGDFQTTRGLFEMAS